jgi:hypothetical protein
MQTAIKRILTILNGSTTLKTYLGATVSDPKIYPAISVTEQKFPCITYNVVDASFRFPPSTVQDITLQFDIFVSSPNNVLVGKQLMENIYTTVNGLLNYYRDSDPLIVWIIQTLEVDNNETDRNMWRKTLRYQIVSKN